MKPVPNLASSFYFRDVILYAFYVLAFLLFISCAGLPVPPKNSPLCVFTNIYLADTPSSSTEPLMDATFRTIKRDIKVNPSLVADKKKPRIMPGNLHFFVCRNSSSTKYYISVRSESADKMIATPYGAYLELQAYYKKLADVFTKELNARTGK